MRSYGPVVEAILREPRLATDEDTAAQALADGIRFEALAPAAGAGPRLVRILARDGRVLGVGVGSSAALAALAAIADALAPEAEDAEPEPPPCSPPNPRILRHSCARVTPWPPWSPDDLELPRKRRAGT